MFADKLTLFIKNFHLFEPLTTEEEEILFVDALLDSQQLYSIDNLTEEFALLRGTLIVIQEIPLIGLYELEIELELTLEK